MTPKRWPAYHLALACAAEQARRTLRSIIPALPSAQAQTVGQACAMLTAGLKARGRAVEKNVALSEPASAIYFADGSQEHMGTQTGDIK